MILNNTTYNIVWYEIKGRYPNVNTRIKLFNYSIEQFNACKSCQLG